jgi:hypothetical protein
MPKKKYRSSKILALLSLMPSTSHIQRLLKSYIKVDGFFSLDLTTYQIHWPENTLSDKAQAELEAYVETLKELIQCFHNLYAENALCHKINEALRTSDRRFETIEMEMPKVKAEPKHANIIKLGDKADALLREYEHFQSEAYQARVKSLQDNLDALWKDTSIKKVVELTEITLDETSHNLKNFLSEQSAQEVVMVQENQKQKETLKEHLRTLDHLLQTNIKDPGVSNHREKYNALKRQAIITELRKTPHPNASIHKDLQNELRFFFHKLFLMMPLQHPDYEKTYRVYDWHKHLIQSPQLTPTQLNDLEHGLHELRALDLTPLRKKWVDRILLWIEQLLEKICRKPCYPFYKKKENRPLFFQLEQCMTHLEQGNHQAASLTVSPQAT